MRTPDTSMIKSYKIRNLMNREQFLRLIVSFLLMLISSSIFEFLLPVESEFHICHFSYVADALFCIGNGCFILSWFFLIRRFSWLKFLISFPIIFIQEYLSDVLVFIVKIKLFYGGALIGRL